MNLTASKFPVSLSLSPQETGIDMNYLELYKLIEGLDRNKDGEINYRLAALRFLV